MAPPVMTSFRWVPGQGYDFPALLRMQDTFRRPTEHMGEAWFMGTERRMFPELAGQLSALSCEELQRPLEEIGSGTSCFGPLPEWTDWYHYLLANLVPRAHETYVDSLLEGLLTAFFTLYPEDAIDEPYPGFKADALATLGRCLMNGHCWNGPELRVGAILQRSNHNPNRVWGWSDASGDFSASLFFCLKYLPDELIAEWVESVLAIASPHWRAQVLVWLVGAHGLLQGNVAWPSEFVIGQVPSISWSWSHCLGADMVSLEEKGSSQKTFIRQAARERMLAVVRAYFTEDRFLEWLSSIDRVPEVRDELLHLPSDFEAMYVRPGRR